MNKKVVHLVTGLATAGMLAATGCVGAQAIRGMMPVETKETVEFAMAENESALSGSHNPGTTSYNEFWQIFREFDNCKDGSYAYAEGKHSVGYDGEILIVTSSGNSNSYTFYTKRKNEPVRYAGTLETKDSIKYKDGVFYVRHIEGSTYSYETYIVSSDGRRLIHREYAQLNGSSYYAYYNSSNKSNDSAYKKEQRDAKSVYQNLEKEYKRLKGIDFKIYYI
ncbi:hypothetical protein D6853_10050 [Butyrivibrio sp. X503]|uniref:hypothetical protein n=1 Tax=Butyrivibrio sp. X503 TaxID=2364878 RepID=UPI000EA97F23|nr:hypothetical protein [Butyrivibrio sp. X503]RKM55879.1 hypothetical protein D6853_10050 [Butyrivibrio sp. X503]